MLKKSENKKMTKMEFLKINKILYLLLFVLSTNIVEAAVGPGAESPLPPPRPGTSNPGGITSGPGAPATPIDTYVLGLGAVAILFAAGYSRRYYHSK